MADWVIRLISVPAGFLRMHLARVFIWSAFGTAVWSGALALAGYGLGIRFGAVERIVGPISSAIIALIVLLYVWRQIGWDKRQARRGARPADGRGDRRP